MVRILVIGAGAGGRAGTTAAAGAGGGSGSIGTWIGPAMFMPDSIRVTLGQGGASAAGGSSSQLTFQSSGGGSAAYNLFNTSAAVSQTGGVAFTNSAFTVSGIFRSTDGQNGTSGNISSSPDTFLTAGAGGGPTTASSGGNITSINYGYPTVLGGLGTTGGKGQDGFFITQPFLLGVGGPGGGGSTTAAGGTGGLGGIGCGGGGGGRCTSGTSLGGKGGDAAAFFWAW